eukprot:scaffold2842_cov123-Skeletonema_marinoi.AAC.5
MRRTTERYDMVGEGGGTACDSYSERSSMARVRASRRTQAQSSSGMSPMRQPHSQQGVMSSQSIPPPPPLPGAPTASVGSHKSNQEKALITLLAEMRDLERKMNTQAAQYEVERQQLQTTLDQQQQEIKSLQQSNQQLAMQHLHLEVKQLRAENMALKREARHSSKKGGHRSAPNQNSSSRSGVVSGDDDDLASNLSGMSSTILSGMLESPRMKDAMKGFLHSPTKSRAPTRRRKESPTSILKQSGRYDSRQDDNNVRRGGGYQQRSKSVPSLPPRLPHMMNSGKKVARFAGVDDAEFDCDWGDAESEV